MEKNIRRIWEFEGVWEGEGRQWGEPHDTRPKTQYAIRGMNV
jgi:hypothetical protein